MTVIAIKIKGEEISCAGLIPGQDVLLILNDKHYVLHRNGAECHAHEITGQEKE